MQSLFAQISTYFAYLVSVTPHIKNFVGTSERELLSMLNKTNRKDDPFLVLFGYEGKLDGNNQRTIGTRTVSFSILFRVTDADNFADQYEKINRAEDLGLQVLARINQDSQPKGGVDWLKGAFRKDSVRFSEVSYQTANGLFGCEFHFDLEAANPLIADSDFWTDKDFC